jgi:LmbE family N-acetylglucosaminyl deacetylase
VVSPLLAKYAHEGHAVHLLSLTAGEKGIREHAGIPAGEALRVVRTREFACAATALGLTSHTLLDFPDQGFAPGGGNRIWKEAVAQVREAITRIRADVLITWGPEGGTGHTDHRAVNSVVVQAFQQRSLLAYKPRKLFYAVFPEIAAALEPDWAAETRVSREFITTDIDCGAHREAAERAIECYRSQWTPELMAKVRGICEAEHGHVLLRLAYSTAWSPDVIETDVFSGL